MKEQLRTEPRILAAAERQMRAWAQTQEIADRTIRLQDLEQMAAGVYPYLALSREEGAGGSEIAEKVGAAMQWEVLDRNLLDRVAERYRLSQPMLKLVDETRSNWVHDVLGTWMDSKIIPTEKYITHLTCVVLAAARQGSVILVGRGAQFLLPREKGLAVRIIAPLKYRVAAVKRRDGLDGTAARRLIQERDEGRREFVRRYFHHDIDDPHLYDLVVNVEGLGRQGAVEEILAALKRWAG